MSTTTYTHTHTRYTARVESLPAAWAFVMSCVDRPEVGPDPRITISPVWVLDASTEDLEENGREFDVSVEGSIETEIAETETGPGLTLIGGTDGTDE